MKRFWRTCPLHSLFLIFVFFAVLSAGRAATAAQLTVAWDDRATTETGFKVERKTGTAGTYAQVGITAANITTYVDSSLANNTMYCYRARAYNTAGHSVYSNEDCATTSVPDGIAPTITLTAPANGATVTNTITVAATATDNVGVVGVQFKVNGVNLGAEDLVATYAVAWNTRTVANGSRTLTAVARDAAGNTKTSTVVTVTVNNPPDTTPPTVTISAPANGVTLANALLTVAATATDNVGVAGVQFKLNGVNLGAEDTVAPHAIGWNTLFTANGTYSLTAVARDAAGNTKTATAVSLRVANTAPPQGSGLVAAYSFNATSGTVLADVSGNNRHGTLLNSPTWVAGRFGNALSFDGVNDYVTMGDVDLPGAFTVSMWAQAKNLGSGCHGSAVMKRFDYGLEVCNGQMLGQVGKGAGPGWAASTSYTIPLVNVWSYYTLTYDGTTARLYVNGVLRSSATGAHVTNNNPLMIGAWTPTSEFFSGLIDAVRIYSRALIPAEIHRDMLQGVTGPYAITVSKAGTGGGTVSGPGISCGSDCSQSYAGNTSVTLTAVPAAGSTWGGWSGSCTGTGACRLSMTAAKAVTATFTRTP